METPHSHPTHPTFSARPLADAMEDNAFPCMMAKAVFAKGNAHIISCEDMADLSQPAIAKTLERFYAAVVAIEAKGVGYHSILLQFDRPDIGCEHHFETLLWNYLQALHREDARYYAWDPAVDSDPASPNFSFSLRGEAFYIIGLHPKSSRMARQSVKPTLVFNLHRQFEKLRRIGTYEAVRDKIRARDMAYSGSVNPMLQDFGDSSEAMQYSGRAVDKENWQCPFHAQSQPKA